MSHPENLHWWRDLIDGDRPVTYESFEQSASLIRTVQVQYVPELLQSPEYARHVQRVLHPGASPMDIERRVDELVARQQLLYDSNAPWYWAVVERSALLAVGDERVTKSQLAHIRELCTLRHVNVQILLEGVEVAGETLKHHWSSRMGAADGFTVLRFADEDLPEIVHVDKVNSSAYLAFRPDAEEYIIVMNEAAVFAKTVDDSQEMIHDALATKPSALARSCPV
jgi:hypothetical protein